MLMNLEQMQNKILKKFPSVKLEYDKQEDIFVLENIFLVKRFDMSFSWNVKFKLLEDKVTNETFTCNTHTNSSIDYEKAMPPTKEVEERFYKILALLKADK